MKTFTTFKNNFDLFRCDFLRR